MYSEVNDWGTSMGWVRFFLFFFFLKERKKKKLPVLMWDVCFVRGAQFFTLREWCHGHNLRLTTSHIMDADRMFSALTQDFKNRLLLWRCWGLFVSVFHSSKKGIISWLWFSSCKDTLCFSIYQSVIVSLGYVYNMDLVLSLMLPDTSCSVLHRKTLQLTISCFTV